MAFSENQIRALKRNVAPRHARTRVADGRQFTFIEGWHAIAEANRIFGFDGWDRETLELKCVATRNVEGGFVAIYVARVRVTVRGDSGSVVREGHGSSEGRGASAYEAHSMGLKGAETDATKRALATFGKPFGLALYGGEPRENAAADAPEPTSSPGRSVAGRKIPGPVTAGRITGNSTAAPSGAASNGNHRIEKHALTIGTPKRHRDKKHLRYVALKNCLVCGLKPADAHHIRYAQPRAFGMKVSDEFTVPLCRGHHRELHNHGNEASWWHDMGIDPLPIAKRLWQESSVIRSKEAEEMVPSSASDDPDPGATAPPEDQVGLGR